MAETKPIPVRLTDGVIDRLDAVALRMGNTRAGVIKLCLDTFLQHVEKVGESALPIDWPRILDELDGRTKASKDRLVEHRADVSSFGAGADADALRALALADARQPQESPPKHPTGEPIAVTYRQKRGGAQATKGRRSVPDQAPGEHGK